MSSIEEGIEQFKNILLKNELDATSGLGKDLFLFASTLLPIINVDVLIADEINRLLMSWRDDEHCGQGWHILGGGIRLKETLIKIIHECSIEELGVDVD